MGHVPRFFGSLGLFEIGALCAFSRRGGLGWRCRREGCTANSQRVLCQPRGRHMRSIVRCIRRCADQPCGQQALENLSDHGCRCIFRVSHHGVLIAFRFGFAYGRLVFLGWRFYWHHHRQNRHQRHNDRWCGWCCNFDNRRWPWRWRNHRQNVSRGYDGGRCGRRPNRRQWRVFHRRHHDGRDHRWHNHRRHHNGRDHRRHHHWRHHNRWDHWRHNHRRHHNGRDHRRYNHWRHHNGRNHHHGSDISGFPGHSRTATSNCQGVATGVCTAETVARLGDGLVRSHVGVIEVGCAAWACNQCHPDRALLQ